MQPRSLIYTPLVCILVACGGKAVEEAPAAPSETAPRGVPSETITPVPVSAPETALTDTPMPTVMNVAPSPTAEPTPTAEPYEKPMTATPYPGPTPTSASLNEPVPAVSVGEYACGDYPCFDDAESWTERIQLPPGFVADIYGLVEPHPTSITFGPDGLLYLARQEGEIVTINAQGDVKPYVGGFYQLVGIAFQPGTERLFAASRAQGDAAAVIWVIEKGNAQPLYEDLPCCYGGWHQANGIAFGPDGYGYVAIGARSDHGEVEQHSLEAGVLRFDPSGGLIEMFAPGLRNTFDIAWDGDGRLFGADNMPDYGPPEEFNVIEPGRHHGFPYYNCEDCTPPPTGLEIVPPKHELLAHSAPTGITAYLSEQFPGYYNNIFLTLWSAFPGAQKVVRFGPDGQGMTDFATGFAAPVDITVGPSGRLYVADWATGVVFAISYAS